MNYARYGLFITSEFHLKSFKAAYGAISRIRHDEWRRYIVFPKDAREKAYAVSSAARELRPLLDGRIGEYWRAIGCNNMKFTDCPEIVSMVFMWALRDAVQSAGHYHSGREASAFYERVASEINLACDAGRIQCLPERATFAPPFRWHYIRDSLIPAKKLVGMLVRMGEGNVGSPPSTGDEFQLRVFEDMVGRLSRRTHPMGYFRGWVASRDSQPEIATRDLAGAPFTVRIKTDRATEKERVLQGFHVLAFQLATDCLAATCEIVVKGSEARVFQIQRLSAGANFSSPDMYIFLDSILVPKDPSSMRSATEKLEALQVSVARAIANAYAAVMPVLATFAIIGFSTAIVLPRRFPFDPRSVVVLTLACIIAAGSRIAMLAYLDATSIPAVNYLYLSPAFPFFLTFVVLGLYLEGSFMVEAFRRNRQGAETDPGSL
jgi:hypothetical protein